MKTLAITAVSFLGILVMVFLYMVPVSTNFVRYLWWRFASGVEITEGRTQSHGASIHYVVFGSGNPVILLHGGLSNKICWFSQIPTLSAHGFQIILVDSRGHGISELGDSELSYHLLAEDALAILNDRNISQTAVIGWSDGANTALQLANEWPARIGKIVAISGNYSPQGLTSEAHRDQLKRSSGLQYWLFRWLTGAGEKFAALENRLKPLWNNYPTLQASDLETIQSPVLIILGDHDLVTTEHARIMAKLIPRSTLHLVHGGGHATMITHATEVNREVIRFFQLHQ